MKESNTKPQASENGGSEAIDWEQRPGGMLVQKRQDGADPTIPLIKIKVFHDSYKHDVTVPAQSTFGELKRVLVQETGLAPEEQRLLFRGKAKNDDECLHMAGVKDTSKVVLLQDPACRERKLEQTQLDQELVEAFEAVGVVRVEVDKLVEKVNTLESSLRMGTKVADQEFVVLTELLMRLLLKLDGIEADGEAKMQRRTENLVKFLFWPLYQCFNAIGTIRVAQITMYSKFRISQYERKFLAITEEGFLYICRVDFDQP
ncbi:BAG family molecular chaperone regulator 4 [Platanthera guangdongensis]|uniref:BAG family molecular chaperone regulator 4 n=1 Tax=Platanthera guangdongensis TaxID=2320717 RepID=A0ABR2MRE4_9ASPA